MKLPKSLAAKADKALKVRLKELSHHFKSDKWDLAYECIEEGLIEDIVPGLQAYIKEAIHAKFQIGFKEDFSLVIRQKKAKTKRG